MVIRKNKWTKILKIITLHLLILNQMALLIKLISKLNLIKKFIFNNQLLARLNL